MITKQRAWTRDNRMVTNVSTFYDDLITTRNTGRQTIINKNKITIPLNSIWVDKLEIEIIGNELENPELIH